MGLSTREKVQDPSKDRQDCLPNELAGPVMLGSDLRVVWFFGNKLQDIARLAVQLFADSAQSRKTHTFDLARSEQGQVLLGDSDCRGEVLAPDFTLSEDHIEMNNNRHGNYLHKLPVLLFQFAPAHQHVANHPQDHRQYQHLEFKAAQRNREHALSRRMIPGQ